jgi:hypothetical protein
MLGGFLHICTCTCTIYCGLWPPDNTSCIFLTWYQSYMFFFLARATRAPIQSHWRHLHRFSAVVAAVFLTVDVARRDSSDFFRSAAPVDRLCPASNGCSCRDRPPAEIGLQLVASVLPIGSDRCPRHPYPIPDPPLLLGPQSATPTPTHCRLLPTPGTVCGLPGRLPARSPDRILFSIWRPGPISPGAGREIRPARRRLPSPCSQFRISARSSQERLRPPRSARPAQSRSAGHHLRDFSFWP